MSKTAQLEEGQPEVIVERPEDGIAVVRINRPAVRNALNIATRKKLAEEFALLSEDGSVRAIVLTGNKEAFAAGADLREFIEATPIDLLTRHTERLWRVISSTPQPVIAAINGFALGGGLELAMACHLRIAADTAKVGQPEINLGLIPGFGGSQRLLRLAGRAATLELCLLGAPITAERALQLGIVNRVAPAAELEAETRKLAEQLAASAPLALRATLDIVNVGGECAIEEGLQYESAQFGLMFATEDMREGTRAFLERRKPAFEGR